jgi:hypothetical protein
LASKKTTAKKTTAKQTEAVRSIFEERPDASRRELRQTDAGKKREPLAVRKEDHEDQPPTYTVEEEVHGEEREYIVTPSRVDPIEARPGKRDTLAKDLAHHEAGKE